MNEVIKLLKSHTSIRKFTEERITDEQVQHILEAAMQGATAGNLVKLKTVIIRGDLR